MINHSSPRVTPWPQLLPEPSYPGAIALEPLPDSPPPRTVWTDGSICAWGGSAALQWDSGLRHGARLLTPHSSTQCELVALTLVSHFALSPPRVLTDSLCSLQLLRSWAQRPMAAVLACQERAEVRAFLYQWQDAAVAPVLEKVKAHDAPSCRRGCPKALGNDAVDGLAKAAASSARTPLYVPDPRGEDAVQLQDAAGVWLRDVTGALTAIWWEARRAAAARRRRWLAALYPAGMAFDWPASTHIFRDPLVESGKFVHFAEPPVLKWVARARSGALMSSNRFAKTHRQPPPPCPCCGSPLEDDFHMVCGCSATGSEDCAAFAAALWAHCNQARGAGPTALPPDWAVAHLPQLAVALIPADLAQFSSPSELWPVSFILRDFHLGMARWLAERLRRREQIVGTALAARSSQLPPGAAVPAPPEVQAFQLTVPELRTAERSQAPAPGRPRSCPGARPSGRPGSTP